MSFRSLLNVTLGGVTILFLFWITAFKVVDSDFWWHVKAGQLMWETMSMITIDPFAYTREGLPYLARHEWLAQIVLYLVHSIGGATGIILLRALCAIALAAILLMIDRRNIWPNALLVMAAAIVMRQGLIERPQLFTNIFFALSLFIGLKLLDINSSAVRKRLLIALVGIQIIWVNMHGAAAVLSFVILGSVFLQELFEVRRGGTIHRSKELILCGGALLIAMFISPNTYHNFTYFWNLLTDETAQLIREWSPHPWSQYLSQTWLFWVTALSSLVLTRRKWLALGLILLTIGLMSRMASRHEVLFLIAALGITFYELKWNDWWQDKLDWIRERKVLTIGATAIALLIILYLNAPYRSFLLRNNNAGFGSFEPAKGAYDFVEKHGIQGNMFNNYGIGGYLLYRACTPKCCSTCIFPGVSARRRGAPERKVFIDGRNVDYGYAFLEKALAARYDASIFTELEEEYGLTHAILEFESTKEAGQSFDFSFLNDNPDLLTYVDDWASVYLKNTAENQPIIDEFGYSLITPENLDRGTVLKETDPSQAELLEKELLRVIEYDPRGINGLLVLAKLYRSFGIFDEAMVRLAEAIRRAPNRYEPYEVVASILAAQQKWNEAGMMYEKAIELTKHLPVTPNYERLAEIWGKAGEEGKARRYRGKGGG